MDIVYKRGAQNQADALSRRADLRDNLQKLRLLEDWTSDEAEEDTDSFVFFLQSQLQPDANFYQELREAYTKDLWLTTRRSLPSYLVQHSDGIYRAYRSRVYIPDVNNLRRRVLQELHDSSLAGHPGASRLLASAVQVVWWPKFGYLVRNYAK